MSSQNKIAFKITQHPESAILKTQRQSRFSEPYRGGPFSQICHICKFNIEPGKHSQGQLPISVGINIELSL